MSEPASSRTDAELVARSKNGDVDAFGDLYRRYFEQIFKYIRSRVSSELDAEDLTETVFLNAFRSLSGYQERGYPFSAYLYQIARNVLVDHYRAVDLEVDLESVAEMSSSFQVLDEGLIQGELNTELMQALGALSEDYREVIRLRILVGLPTSAVASWMDRSDGAVRILLYRALQALRNQFESRHGD